MLPCAALPTLGPNNRTNPERLSFVTPVTRVPRVRIEVANMTGDAPVKFPLRPSDVPSMRTTMRRRHLTALAGQPFDLLVIGGGIFGGGVARDAALRGLRVALIDKGDFAGGTSSRSSKLIHGGFRYLEQGSLRLVMEACRERHILQRIAPHLVKPLPFLLPVYRGGSRSLGKVRVGMTLYDMLALYRNQAPHRCLSVAATLEREPGIVREGLVGSVLFYDCQEDDARFCVDNVLHAAELGAACVNHCELTGFVSSQGRLAAAKVTDLIGNDTFEVRARTFVNAAGPWVDRVAGMVTDERRPTLRPTKGVHVLLPRMTEGHALAFQSRRDGRIMFVLPWHDGTLVGTTDTDFHGDANSVHADADDLNYVLTEVQAMIPGALAERSDVITTFAGLRPLLHASQSTHPSSRSREWQLLRHADNMLTIAGGKYTTYRATAERVVDEVAAMLDARVRRCQTATTPLPCLRPAASGERLSEVPDVYESDVRHACDAEMAMTVEDVMRRRTPLALTRHGGAETAAAIARIMGLLMGWDEAQARASLDHYLAGWELDRACVHASPRLAASA